DLPTWKPAGGKISCRLKAETSSTSEKSAVPSAICKSNRLVSSEYSNGKTEPKSAMWDALMHLCSNVFSFQRVTACDRFFPYPSMPMEEFSRSRCSYHLRLNLIESSRNRSRFSL